MITRRNFFGLAAAAVATPVLVAEQQGPRLQSAVLTGATPVKNSNLGGYEIQAFSPELWSDEVISVYKKNLVFTHLTNA